MGKAAKRGRPIIPISHDRHDVSDLALNVARRLVVTRMLVGGANPPGSEDWSPLSQTDFGKEAGFKQPEYHQWETGKRLLGVERALELCAVYGLTTDWIYLGDPSNIAGKYLDALRALRKQDPDLDRRINADLAAKRANGGRKRRRGKAPS